MNECDFSWSESQPGSSKRGRGANLQRLAKSPGGMVGAVIMVLVLLVAILAPVISPHDPQKQNITQRLKPPVWAEGGSVEHLLGTDSVGRDLLSRIIHGSRVSMLVGLAATSLSAVLGITLGLLAGFLRGPYDATISRVGDMQQAIPDAALWVIPNGEHVPILGHRAPQFLELAMAFFAGNPLD